MTDKDLSDRVAALERELDSLSVIANHADDKVVALREENESLRQEVAALRERVEEQTSVLDILSPEQDTSRSRDTRAAIALATMWNRATNSNGVYALDADGVADANNGEVKRAWAFQIMESIPSLVGDTDICWIEEGEPAGDNTRAILDLTERQDAAEVVPNSAEGVPIQSEVVADD